MRCFLLVFAFLLTLQLAHAQVSYRQGTVLLDGATSLSVGNEAYHLPGINWSNLSVWESSGIRAQSRPIGIFAFDRLLVGARLSYQHDWSGENFFSAEESSETYRVNPFLRYYILAGSERKWNLFAELGFGTLGTGQYSTYETDFHLAAGVDIPLLPGVVATSRLAYNAYADGLNFTTFEIGGNLLLGQLGTPSAAPLSKGTWTTQAELMSASFGHMRRGENDWISYDYQISPSIGYFVLDGLVLSSVSSLSFSGENNEITFFQSVTLDNTRFYEYQTEVAARYYPLRKTRLLPYVAVSAGYRYASVTYPEADGQDRDRTSALFGAAAGLSYFLGQNVAVEVSANYRRERMKISSDLGTGDPIKLRQLNLETGFAFYFGK